MKFRDDLIVKDALPLFFENYHFKDGGGYNDAYFKIKIGNFYLPVPNIEARKQGAKLHDIHHILTEIEATWFGEVKIGVWELYIGCKKSWPAWLLNSGAVIIGFFLYQKAIKEGYQLAKQTQTNLYHLTIPYDELLKMTVGELRTIVFKNHTNTA